jgi:D-serine deaminase-like pyridoxal phosphate-dependent protein
VDAERLARNVQRMQSAAHALGVHLRPHVKTAKSVPVGRLQQQAGASGITVSTLREAEVFFEAGFRDILYAVGIVPQRLAQVLALRRAGCALKLIVDALPAAQAVVAAGRETGHAFEVLVEIDVDGQRAGVQPDSAELLSIGRALHEGGMLLAGVMTHGGGSYAMRGPEALAAFAEQERARCVHAAQRLRAAGLPCPIVSTGSTPTALHARRAEGVTEMRAGVYVFFDLVMAGLGVCTLDELALSVLTTVIGHQPDKGWVLLDAGWMALSRDRGTQDQPLDQGYGLVCDADGRPLGGASSHEPAQAWVVAAANQEHGIMRRRDGSVPSDLPQRFPVGSRLRVLPNHACATAAQFDRYAVRAADGGLTLWPRFSGW